MLALNVLCQYTKCHVLIVRIKYSEYAQRHRGRRPAIRARTDELPAPRALALRTTGVTYPGTPEHVSAVRADLRPILRGCPLADEVILCASELAANAAIHSHSRLPGSTFTVRAKVSPGDYAWIEVEDNGGPWTPAVRDPTQHHGLDIVRALASDSGIDGDQNGRIIWARFDWAE